MELLDRKKQYLIVGAHLLVWLVLFGLPWLIFTNDPGGFELHVMRSWIPLAGYALIFYANYLLFIKRYLFTKKFTLFIIFNLLLLALVFTVSQLLRDFNMPEMMPKPENMDKVMPFMDKPAKDFNGKPPVSLFMFMDALFLLIPLALSFALKVGERWLKIEKDRSEIENKQLETELQHLRYQLQPHFFFNSLNNIYSLIETYPAKAQEAVHSLSKLMRYLLYETEQSKVDLAQEIYFMERYIQLMDLRLTDKTKTIISFPEKVPQKYYIAPLLFIPLIENAYKHGVSTAQNSSINFQIVLIGGRIHFSSENTNNPKNKDDRSGSGIGIENLKKRLQLLYPQKYIFNSGLRGDTFWTVLILDLE
jgi:hypothetical protein